MKNQKRYNKAPINLWENVEKLWEEYSVDLPKLTPLDRFISKNLSHDKKYSKNQKTWVSKTLFDCARFFELTDSLSKSPKHALYFLALRAGIGPQPERPRFLNIKAFDELKSEASKGELCDESLLWNAFPIWAARFLKERIQKSEWTDKEVIKFLKNHVLHPPLWVRLNNLERKKEFLSECRTAELSITKHKINDRAFQVSGDVSLFELPCFKTGTFEIQDLASQAIGEALDVRPGQMVWDACAGSGGKSLQLGSLLSGKGALYVSDMREHALKDTRLRLRRAGITNFREFHWDGSFVPEQTVEIKNRKGFDRVLVDAPCSASGTWRRNPDAKLRYDAKRVLEFPELQLNLLSKAAQALRVGGKLVYATCSFFVFENEDVVDAFLKTNGKGFELESQNLHGSPFEDSDTTFTAVFKRKD